MDSLTPAYFEWHPISGQINRILRLNKLQVFHLNGFYARHFFMHFKGWHFRFLQHLISLHPDRDLANLGSVLCGFRCKHHFNCLLVSKHVLQFILMLLCCFVDFHFINGLFIQLLYTTTFCLVEDHGRLAPLQFLQFTDQALKTLFALKSSLSRYRQLSTKVLFRPLLLYHRSYSPTTATPRN